MAPFVNSWGLRLTKGLRVEKLHSAKYLSNIPRLLTRLLPWISTL